MKHTTDDETARRIRLAIASQGVLHTDIAAKANISRTTLSLIIHGRTQPRQETLEKIAKALGIDVASLLPESEPSIAEASIPAESIPDVTAAVETLLTHSPQLLAVANRRRTTPPLEEQK